MKSKVYIVADRRGVQRMTKNPPDLFRGELAVALTVNIPDNVFRDPVLSAALDVPESAVIHPEIAISVGQDILAQDRPEETP